MYGYVTATCSDFNALPMIIRPENSNPCNRVGLWYQHVIMALSYLLDRTSLPPSATEMHTHLAHSLVRYLGLSSPAEMAEYGISSARDLVDIISRVGAFFEH